MSNYVTKVYEYVDNTSGAHIVKATTTYAGKTISAYSKCDPRDTFDIELGVKVALKRLDIKIAKKRAASMREYAKFCKTNLQYIEAEKRRTKKAMERAKVAMSDRSAEIKQFEAELAEMLKNA